MGWWLAGEGDGALVERSWVKRFDPRFWTVNFPRPMMAAVTTTAADALRVDLSFYRGEDLAGLIWESADRFDHVLLRYETSKDYRSCKLRFRWRSVGGLLPLDAANGPTLTIEGRDAEGAARTWYVRLWNYADGMPADAVVSLDFADLREGFEPGGAPVFAGDIDRLFVSLAPVGYGSAGALPERVEATLFVEDIVCDGGGSTLAIGDPMVPPHELRIASGYDDSYHLTPARLLRNALQLGYRGWIDHYVGMSHWFELAPSTSSGQDGTGARFEVTEGLNAPCRRWHGDFARRAGELGYRLILSLSYELFDAHAPESWKQRDAEGRPALTGWEPPSTLLSPANAEAMAYLREAALAFCGIARDAGAEVHFQIGEPWWWTGFGGERPACFYDGAATALYASETGRSVPVPMTDARDAPTPDQQLHLDWLGEVLGRSTLSLRDAVKAAFPEAKLYLLFYAPQVIEADAVHLTRVNMPPAWAWPAFDVLQLEDYDFVIAGDEGASRRATEAVTATLGYPPARQHYFAGFVLKPEDAQLWRPIAEAAVRGRELGVAATFVWALPQVLRDGFTWFDQQTEGAVEAFHDVRFPVEIGLGACVAPTFATDVFAAASGFEQRNSRWADARLSFDAGLGVRSEAELGEVIAFFRARRGQAAGFRFRDPSDFSSNGMDGVVSARDVALGIGDGARTRFELVKRYGEGTNAQVRRITRPEAGSVRVAIDGVEAASGWALAAGGVIEFDMAPGAGAVVTAGFRFDVPVRFAEDRIEVSLTAFRAGEVPSIPLVEVREV